MDDIVLAQQIVANRYRNIKKDIYHDTSFIFAATNEKINLYSSFYQNKSKILSVIGSGDQMLNMILSGCKKIDGFDISRFPKYFLELKKSGILSLSRDDYINFFFDIDCHKNELYDDMYFEMRNYLKQEDRNFWDGLINFYDWSEINESTLFSSQTVVLDKIIEYNPYLQKENYLKLKELILNIKGQYYTGNIQLLSSKLNYQYDFIHLSSIIYYVNQYKKLLLNLPLGDNGMSLTYLYQVTQELIEGYLECQIIPFHQENVKEGVMVYKK